MKKKSVIEADLDPTGSRHTRPGAKAAEVAIRDSKLTEKRLKKITSTSSRGRAGATAANRPPAAKRKRAR